MKIKSMLNFHHKKLITQLVHQKVIFLSLTKKKKKKSDTLTWFIELQKVMFFSPRLKKNCLIDIK